MTASSGAAMGVVTTVVSPKGSGWRATHEALTRLARLRAGLDFEEGQQLRAAQLARVHERLGYGSFVEYIERLFGYAPRLTLEKLRVAEALERLPALADALRIGKAGWSTLRELARVATSETEREWLDATRGKTVREVERLVSGHRPGDFPGDLKDAGAERHVLRFEVSGDVLATFREAVAKLRQEAGSSLDDATTPTTCSRCAARIIALVIAATCSSRKARPACSNFATRTGPRTAKRHRLAPST